MKRTKTFEILLIFLLAACILPACTSQTAQAAQDMSLLVPTASVSDYDVEFTLQTGMENGRLIFKGIGGDIDGVVNPDLNTRSGDNVHIVLLNGDGMTHDFFLPDFDARTSYVSKIGDRAEITFEVGDMAASVYVYYCTLPGHRQAGQEGKLIVMETDREE